MTTYRVEYADIVSGQWKPWNSRLFSSLEDAKALYDLIEDVPVRITQAEWREVDVY